MYKNRIRNIVIHEPEGRNIHTLADKVNAFHVTVIERKLNQSLLTIEQKVAVIDKIIEILKSQDVDGFIK